MAFGALSVGELLEDVVLLAEGGELGSGEGRALIGAKEAEGAVTAEDLDVDEVHGDLSELTRDRYGLGVAGERLNGNEELLGEDLEEVDDSAGEGGGGAGNGYGPAVSRRGFDSVTNKAI